jgi:hypothetical protein
MMKTILLCVALLLSAGCATRKPEPLMAKAEAMRILEHENPNSKEAILALQEHAKREYEAQRRERDARLLSGEAVEPSPFASGRTGINQGQ